MNEYSEGEYSESEEDEEDEREWNGVDESG